MTDLDVGDLDGDGDLDVVCAGSVNQVHRREASYVTVFLNRGDGVFEPAVGYDAGLEATAVKLADMDGDGDLDAVVANAFDDSVSVFEGLGDGTFGQRRDVPVGDEPRAIVVGDFDADGDIDGATINTMSDDASILLNDGSGTLVLSQSVAIGGVTPRGLGHRGFPYAGPWHAVGDIDGDGDLDLAIPATGRVKFLVNDGAGRFTMREQAVSTPNPWAYALALVDLEGDGDLDLGAIESGGGGTSFMDTWRNDGAGAFTHIGSYDSAFNPYIDSWFNTGLAFGDLDGDGDADAAVATENGEGAVIFRNLGDGSFGPMEVLPNEWGPWAVVLADVSGDGWLDHLSLTADTWPSLHARFNDGAGSILGFEPASEDLFAGLRQGGAGDLDGDGDIDVVLTDLGGADPHVRVFSNDGTGRFSITFTRNLLVREFPGFGDKPKLDEGALVDLDGDGDLDLVTTVNLNGANLEHPGAIWWLLNDGTGAFPDASLLEFEDFLPMTAHAVDVDGDGHEDVALWGMTPRNPSDTFAPVDRRVLVLLSDGRGGLSIAGDYFLAHLDPVGLFGEVRSGDVDGDGDQDLIATAGAWRDSTSVYTLLNDGRGGYTVGAGVPITQQGEKLQVGDWDGDGDVDAAVMHIGDNVGLPYLTILDNVRGELVVSRTFEHQNAFFDNGFLAHDVNDDGHLDLVLSWNGVAGVQIHLNDGHGDFSNVASYSLAGWTYGVHAADFDGDGDTDLLGAGGSHTPFPLMLLRGEPGACAADTNGDGEVSGEDFLLLLERFAEGAGCDVDLDTDCDSDDLFTYLELFARGCET